MARSTFNLEIEYINVGLTNDSLSPLLSSRVEISFTYKNVVRNSHQSYFHWWPRHLNTFHDKRYLKLWMHFIQQNDAISKR